MPVYDFSSGLGLLNQGISSLGDALGNRTDAQAFAQIGNALQRGDYNSAAGLAWQAGKPDIAMKLQGMAFSMGAANAGYPGAGGDGTSTTPLSAPPRGGGGGAGADVNVGPATGGSGPRAEPSGNRFTDTLVGAESLGSNIVSKTDKDSRGLTLAQGGNPAEISQGYFQIQNHPGGTWSIYAPKAGVDLTQYPTPQTAPYAVQHAVAQQIPIGQWGPRTLQILQQRFGPIDKNLTLGQVEQRYGGAAATAATGGRPPDAQAQAAPAPAAPGPQAAPGGLVGSANAAPAAPPPGGAPNALAAANQGAQPQGPPMPQVMLMRAIQSGQINERQLEANWQRFNLPDPGQPANQQFWQALRNTPQGAGGAQPAPANVASAGATQTPGGPQPTQLSPGGPGTPPTPTQPGSLAAPGLNPADAMGAPVTGGYTRGDLRTALAPSATPGVAAGGTTPAAAPARSQPTTGPAATGSVGSPVSPPPPQRVAKDVPAPQSSAEPPAAIQPKSAKGAPVDQPGPYGPPTGRGGAAWAQDFGPGKGQMWGPGGTVVGAGGPGSVPGPGANAAALGQQALARRGVDPTVAPFMPPTGAPQPGAGAMPAALGGPGAGAAPPGAMTPPPGAQPQQGGLGAMLGGLPAGLLNLASMQPPGGVPGLPTPAQRLGYGAPAPMPGQPGFPGVGPGGPGGAPPQPPMGGGGGAPMAAPAPVAAVQQPAAAAPAAQPPVDPALALIDQRIQAATQRELALRQYSQRISLFNPEMAKASLEEANKLSDQINELTKEREGRVTKSGETQETAVKEQASKRIDTLATTHAQLTGATGVKAITDNINAMEKDLPQAITGYGNLNELWQHLASGMAKFDPAFAGAAAGSEDFNARANVELGQMAEQLFGMSGGRLNRAEFQALRSGMLKLSDRPDVVYDLLEMSRQRALDLAQQHNDNVDAAANAYGKYGGKEAASQYKIKITEPMQKSPAERPTSTKSGAGLAGSQSNPIKVTTDADYQKLPAGAYWQGTNPDGSVHIGQKPGPSVSPSRPEAPPP